MTPAPFPEPKRAEICIPPAPPAPASLSTGFFAGSILSPSVATLSMNSRMTGMAQCHQVTVLGSSAFPQWLDVMDLLSLGQNPTLKAQLTERMLRCISITDPLPCTAILALCIPVSAVSLIVTVHFALVLAAISAARRNKPAASRISTGLLRFLRHPLTFFPTYKEP